MAARSSALLELEELVETFVHASDEMGRLPLIGPRCYPPQGDVPGLDTLPTRPQTDLMRSTIDTGLPHDYGQYCECIECVGCDHTNVEQDDDGISRRFNVCLDCHQEVVLSEPDEDGQSFWEVV